MRPGADVLDGITQTITDGDGSGMPGNCLQAAVATLLGLTLDEVPHFTAVADDWLEAFAAFARSRGDTLTFRWGQGGPLPAFGLVFGRSPRGLRHAVVASDGRIVWDPHPSRAGVITIEDTIEWALAHPAGRGCHGAG